MALIAQRRHHRERLKKNRRYYWGRDMLTEAKYLSMVVETPNPNGWVLAGNLRPYEGLTIQERRHD